MIEAKTLVSTILLFISILPLSSSFQVFQVANQRLSNKGTIQDLKMTASSSSSSSSPSTSTSKKSTIALVGVTCNSEKDPSPILREGITDLFKLYFDELYDLGCDLGFQGFQNEWIDLPGKYSFEDRGGIYVAVEIDMGDNGDDSEEEVLTIQPGMDLQHSKLKLADLLKDKNQVVGCIAIRTLTESCGELKRMYIRKSHRRLGIGKLLAKCIMNHGWDKDGCNYQELKLDSLERLGGAVTLYENLGFQRIDPYCECPEDDHVCMSMFRE